MAESYSITAVLSAKVDGMVSGFKEATGSLDNFADKHKKTFDSFKKVGAGMTAVGAGIAGGLGMAVKKAAEFEGGMSKVSALSGATGKDLDELSEKARELGSATSFSATEAAEGLEYMALAGWDNKQMMEGLEPVLHLAEAGSIDLGRASDLVTDSMASMGIEVQDLSGYLDKVAETSANANTDVDALMEAFVIAGGTLESFNVPLEESSALLGVMADRGLKGSEAGQALNVIMARIGDTSGTAGKKLKEMGIDVYDSEGNFRGMETVLKEVEVSMADMNEEQRADAKLKIAGLNHGKNFDKMMGGLGDGYDELKDKVANSNGSLKEMRDIMKDNLQGAMENLSSAGEEIMISLGTALLPVVKDITKFIQGLADKFNGLSDKTKSTIAIVLAVVAVFLLIVGPLLMIIGFIPAIISGFTAIGLVFTAITSPISLIVLAIIGLGIALVVAYNKVEWFRDMVNAVWEFIKDSIILVIEVIKETVANVLEFINNLWEEYGETLIEVATNIWDTIMSVIDNVITFISDLIEKVLGHITDFWDDHGDLAMEIIRVTWQTIKDTIMIGVNFIKNIIKAGMKIIQGIFEVVWPIISGFIEVTWGIIKTTIKNVIDIIAGIIDVTMNIIKGDWEAVWESIKEIVTNVVDNIVSFFKGVNLFEIGKNIINGLFNGISSMVKGVGKVVGSVGTAIKDSFTNFFVMKSPSKLTFGMGENITAGVANGMTKAITVAKKAANALNHKIHSTLSENTISDDVNKQTQRDLNHSLNTNVNVQKQSANIVLQLGRNDFTAFVADIDKEQDRTELTKMRARGL